MQSEPLKNVFNGLDFKKYLTPDLKKVYYYICVRYFLKSEPLIVEFESCTTCCKSLF